MKFQNMFQTKTFLKQSLNNISSIRQYILWGSQAPISITVNISDLFFLERCISCQNTLNDFVIS